MQVYIDSSLYQKSFEDACTPSRCRHPWRGRTDSRLRTHTSSHSPRRTSSPDILDRTGPATSKPGVRHPTRGQVAQLWYLTNWNLLECLKNHFELTLQLALSWHLLAPSQFTSHTDRVWGVNHRNTKRRTLRKEQRERKGIKILRCNGPVYRMLTGTQYNGQGLAKFVNCCTNEKASIIIQTRWQCAKTGRKL